MADLLLLPTPLATNNLALGQLLSNPLDPTSPSFSSSSPLARHLDAQSGYQDVFSHDDEGHFVSSRSGHSLSSYDSLLSVQADRAETIRLQHPTQAFDNLRRDTAAQAFLRRAAIRHQPLYYVVGLRKLQNPIIKRANVENGSLAESNAKTPMPIHTRHDSATDVTASTDAVFGLEVQKVCCHVGSPSEPHSLSDIGYYWSYHTLDADHEQQLSIGLGKPLQAAELRAMAGIVSDEDFTDESHDEWDSDDEYGHAGFESA